MSSEEGKFRGFTGDPENQYRYGTFQGVANFYPPSPVPPPHPVVGYPRPTPPHNAAAGEVVYFPNGYQTVQGYAVIERRPLREAPLPCCGMGMGWLLFIFGFFFGGIPWYVGALVLLFAQVDYREKPGYVACTIAAILALIAIMLGVAKETHSW